MIWVRFFFQAEDGIRDGHVTGVQTCALPISAKREFATFGAGAVGQNLTLLHAVANANERLLADARSEEGRVGKECRFRWGREHEKKKDVGEGSEYMCAHDIDLLAR